MREIKGDFDLLQCQAAESGYIYNDFSPQGYNGNVLHTNRCGMLAMANTNGPKYYAVGLAEATAWLNLYRRDRWARCRICKP